ncbi:4-hydroxy-3-methylbut-2-enyl diphosphate reductase [Spiroplasma sabaudiense Ar-1343]|uniref:4-hydroxy-3-methylbut-2-enyl diphosphate reductase n=1 Tax=Spiroplasma sabaudiense Ar-1343 TaxID=1276257 RepID=W6A9P8_9MOLU|nr:4-hydroxy-3-methylbut-2-enyl diphosphate reductase [Spiroplasma sabaudiense]AHI53737.1 4-hydroxy-3-methylbut-2-enyl diphosphate reductase [Spiroplasma sabaudiense Ar-1343]
MKVIRVTPRGFCLGVVKSIKLAKQAIKDYPENKIYMIGKIVHNDKIVQEFRDLGVILLDDSKKTRMDLLNEVEANQVVIFSAHGTDPKVIEEAKNKNLIIIDTKCEWVLKTEDLINEFLSKNWKIIFIGKQNHPETIALTSLSKKISLVTCDEDIDNLPTTSLKIMVTNQTTLSKIDTKKLYDKIKSKFPEAVFKNDLCDATLERQEAVLRLNPNDVELLFVVGDKSSNNSNKLVEIAKTIGIDAILIQSKEDINKDILKKYKSVAVTAGASTPSILQLSVIKFLEEF